MGEASPSLVLSAPPLEIVDGHGKRAADTAPEIRTAQHGNAPRKAVLRIEGKPSARTGRVFNPQKPPAIRGYKWSPNGAGFDCRKMTAKGERYVAHLGKKKLAELRALSDGDREKLRELVRVWIREREAA